ncbi:MAG TPA: alpha-2-macroglobulin family protein, partial [Gemmataceae bacterium]
KAEAERLLVTIGQSQPQVTDLSVQELARVEKEYARRIDEAREQVADAGKAEEESREDTEYRAAVVKLGGYDDFIDRARRVGAPMLAALLVLAAIVCLILGLFRKLLRALPYYAATVACAAVVVLLLKLSWGVAPSMPRPEEQQVAQMNQREDKSAPRVEKLGRDLGDAPDPALGMLNEGMDEFKKADKLAAAAAPAPMELKMDAKPDAFNAPAPPGMPRGGGGAKAGKGGFAGQGRQEGGDRAKDMDMFFLQQNRGLGAARDGAALPQARAAGGEKQKLFEKPADDRAADKRVRALAKDRAPEREVAAGGVPMMAPAAGPQAGLALPFRFGIEAKEQAKRPQIAWPAMPVREYRHLRASGSLESRSDFAETLYWHPALVLDGGKAEISFDLCDSLGAFEVTAFAHTLDGRLGSATQTIASRLPFTVQPRTPLEVTAGDQIDIALAVTNNTNEKRTAHITATEQANLSLADGKPAADVSVPADSSIRKLYRFRPTIQEGTATLAFTGKTEAYPADSVRTTFRIVPEGFPVVGSHSDLLEKSASADVVLPQTWIKDTLKCQVNVYPSTLADLQKGLESLLREPCGCFEQTSTSNYPNLLILKYLKESDQAKPALERRARELLDRGYQKLTSFECTNAAKNAKEGYEWFGGTAPAHEALTAYGLMEFRDMAVVHDVNPAMLERTRQYLMNQRDGKGGFKRNPRALDTFGRAPEPITNAYIVWALTESGKDDDITKELTALDEKARTSKDPYFLSLVANSLINRAKTADAVKLLKKAAEAQKPDGHLDAEQTSITGSGGRDLQIETTSLAVLGWLKANPGEFNGNIQKAIRWIGQQRGGYGGFGSTQSTILALKALILYTKANKRTPEAGELRLFVGEKQVGSLPFAAGATEALTLSVPEAETTLKPGKNAVRVEITGKNAFPYTLTWSYQTRQPVSAEKCPVKLSAKLDRAEANEGETVRLNVQVENASGKGQGMTVAILGLPGGLTIPEDMKQLKDYTRQPKDDQRPLVSYFEVRGRELVLYWRDLAPDQKIEVPIDLICRVPGEYSGPASRAYLYYNADLKHWVEPLKVSIAAKAE